MTRGVTVWLGSAMLAFALASGAVAQSAAPSAAKKELVQKALQLQTAEIEAVARSIVERPAAQMMQEAGLAMQRQVAPDKREAMGRAIEAEVKKYVDEAYPLVRERAIRLAPSTLGAALEEKMTEDELKQLIAWFESPANKKYQQLGPARNAFVQKVLSESLAAVDPKVGALDARIRIILGVPPAQAATPAASSTPPARPAAPAARASGK
jgi:uncharacterized protein